MGRKGPDIVLINAHLILGHVCIRNITLGHIITAKLIRWPH